MVIATGKGASAAQLIVILREREALTKRAVEALAPIGEEASEAADAHRGRNGRAELGCCH